MRSCARCGDRVWFCGCGCVRARGAVQPSPSGKHQLAGHLSLKGEVPEMKSPRLRGEGTAGRGTRPAVGGFHSLIPLQPCPSPCFARSHLSLAGRGSRKTRFSTFRGRWPARARGGFSPSSTAALSVSLLRSEPPLPGRERFAKEEILHLQGEMARQGQRGFHSLYHRNPVRLLASLGATSPWPGEVRERGDSPPSGGDGPPGPEGVARTTPLLVGPEPYRPEHPSTERYRALTGERSGNPEQP